MEAALTHKTPAGINVTAEDIRGMIGKYGAVQAAERLGYNNKGAMYYALKASLKSRPNGVKRTKQTERAGKTVKTFRTRMGTEVTLKEVQRLIAEYDVDGAAEQMGYTSRQSVHRIVTHSFGALWKTRRQLLNEYKLPDEYDVEIMEAMLKCLVTDFCSPSTEYVKEETNFVTRTVQDRIKRLVEIGFIARILDQNTNSFYLTDKALRYLVGDRFVRVRDSYSKKKRPVIFYDKVAFDIVGFVLRNKYAPTRAEVRGIVEQYTDTPFATNLNTLKRMNYLSGSPGHRKNTITRFAFEKVMTKKVVQKWDEILDEIS